MPAAPPSLAKTTPASFRGLIVCVSEGRSPRLCAPHGQTQTRGQPRLATRSALNDRVPQTRVSLADVMNFCPRLGLSSGSHAWGSGQAPACGVASAPPALLVAWLLVGWHARPAAVLQVVPTGHQMPLFSSSFSGTSSLCHSPQGPRSPCLQEALLPGRETNQAEGLFGQQEPLQVGDGTPSSAHLSGPAADLARTATRGCLFSEGSGIRTRSWLLRVHSLDAARGSSTQRWSAFPRRITPSPSPVLKGSLKTAQGVCEASFHNLSHLMDGVSVPWRSPKEGSGVPTRPTLSSPQANVSICGRFTDTHVVCSS